MRYRANYKQLVTVGCLLFFLFTFQLVIAQPDLTRVIPKYGSSQVYVQWNTVATAQAYGTRWKRNAGAYSAWDSIGTANTYRYVTLTGTIASTDKFTFQVRVKTGGTWSVASNERATYFRQYWPVRNAAGNATQGLMHNFCQPLEVNNNTYLHEGVDINGDFNVASEVVISSHSALLTYKGGTSPSTAVNMQTINSTSTPYVQYNHLKNLHASLVTGKSIIAGDTLGHLDNTVGSWNTQCYHTHMHYWSNSGNMVGSTMNPLTAFTSNTNRDPHNYFPDIKNTNNDTKDFRLRQAANATYLPDNYIAYNAVDIVWEACDRMSFGGFYQIPKSVGYYIQRKDGANWVNSVKTAATAYKLYDNINWLSPTFGSMPTNLRAGLIDSADALKGIAPTTPTTYVFKQWFTWIITNTKGTNGTSANIDKDQCWATNARSNVVEANGYKASYDQARCIDEAKFPDGEYKVFIPLTDFVHTRTKSKEIKVDNFKPYIKKVTVYSGLTKIYEASWAWNASNARIDFTPDVTNKFAACNQDIKIIVETSEPMKEMIASIPALSWGQTKTTAVANSKDLKWEFIIPTSKLANSTYSKHKIWINGQDKASTAILGFPNTNAFPEASIPKRQADGSWSPNTASTLDKIHYLKIDTIRVKIVKTDVNCYNESDGTATATALSGTSPYTYLWSPTGQTGKVASGLKKGSYSVKVTDKNNCNGNADTIITEPERISVSIAGGPVIIPFCIQDGPPDVTLTATATGGTPAYTYSWANQTKIVNSTGFYTVTVTDSKGCSVDATTFVWFISILCSRDPNDITGPSGYGDRKLISNKDFAPYIIRFENDPEFASAPAQTVMVTMPFDPHLNMYSFRLAEFGFGDFDIQIPTGKTFYTTRVDVKDSLNVYVDVIAGIDATQNEAFWIFESIDPSSGLAPIDPTKGFLLVNDTVTHRGEGYVSFIVTPKNTNTSGDSIKAKAKIVFDVNSAIYTNEWYNIIDAIPPTSKVDSLPPTIDSSSFLVSWSGTDDTSGSGIATYDLFIAANNQSFVLYKKDIEDTSVIFTGSYGVTYKFYTRAKDNVGNKEAAKNIADARITIMPERFFNKPDSTTSQCLASNLTITWKEKDINYINLRYTIDSGQTYHMIADGLPITDLSYSWSLPDSISGNTYYQIAAFNAETNSLFNSSDYFIIRNFPTVDAGSNKDICLGSSISLGGSPTAGGTSDPYYYQWTQSSSLNYDTLSNPLAQPSVDTRYMLTVTDSFGCAAIDSVDVFIHSVPIAGFTINDTSQCQNVNSFTLIDTTSIATDSFSISWSLGDNNSSTLDTVVHSYAVYADYIIKLTATSNYGCIDSVKQMIHVNPMPVAAFTVNDTDQCLSTNSFSFNNTSTISSGSATYLWTASNADTSTFASPVFVFNNDGNYTMKLLSTSDQACQDSVTQQLIVYAAPTVAFNVNDSSQCLNTNQFNFTNSSAVSSGTISYYWTFGDNDTSTSTNPSKTYASDDTFSVKLFVTSDNNCIDSVSANMYVFPVPNVSFTVNDTDQCLFANSFSFTNTSTISSGSITPFWTFGNDSTSTLTNPVTSYISDGNYLVKLHITSGEGCIDSTDQNVYLRPMPVAKFGLQAIAQCLTGNSFNFLDSSTITSGTLSYFWDFDDNVTSALQNPSHTFTTSDTFQVKLLVTSDYACKDSVNKEVITHPMPQANFTVNDTSLCLQNNQFVFSNSSTIGSGTISYAWDFGDNSGSALENPTKTFTVEGTYVVKLLITSSFGCKDSFSRTIYVYPMPVATFSVNDSNQCLNSNSYVFTNNSTISNGSLNYLWKFGNSDTSTATNPTYTYLNNDSFTVWLYVSSDMSCADSSSLNIYVHPNPIAAFTVSDTTLCLQNNQFVFSNSSTISSGNMTYAWDFGDNSVSTLENPTKSYTVEGNYVIQLVVTSPLGCKDSSSRYISVNPMPVASFSVNDSSQCLNTNSFVFTNNSSVISGNLSYLWEFGNGDTSSMADPTISYSSADTFTITLLASAGSGCADTNYIDLFVFPSPVSDFVINDDTQCYNLNHFVFTNTSIVSSGTMTHLWDFGDSNSSSLSTTSHIYLLSDSFAVKLISSTTLGCTDSLVKQVLISPSPVSDFSISDTMQCLNTNSFNFYNSSSIAAGTLTYLWLFGDTNQSVIDNPTHVYQYDSSFVVTLIASSDQLCRDSIRKNVFVLAAPIVDFSVSDSVQCLKNNFFKFTNQSSIDTGSLFYYWAFVSDTDTNSVNFSNLKDPDHIYLNTGQYAVKLKAVSSSACMDSVYKNVFVKATPYVHFTVYDACLGDSSKFYDYSVVDTPATVGTWKWYFGDGDSSFDQNPAHIYDTVGVYTVSLVVGSNESCIDSAATTTQVFDLPTGGYNYTYGSNGRATFTPVADSLGHTYTWYFGDGDSSFAYQPTHKYAANDDYIVKMIVMSSNGCVQTSIDTVTISNCLSEEELEARKFRLEVYPNPFSNSTHISFDLNSGARIKLKVYDVAGKEIETLVDASIRAGRYMYTFGEQKQLPGGVYFIKLFVNDKVYVERVIKVLLPY